MKILRTNSQSQEKTTTSYSHLQRNYLIFILIRYKHYITVNSSLLLTSERIAYLRKEKWTVKKIANFANRSERTVYRWFKPNPKPPQKRGVKSKMTETVVSLLRSYSLENKRKTQQEMADYVYQELGIKISWPSINALLKRMGITHKKLTYHYTQLDEEKVKAFNEEIKLLLP